MWITALLGVVFALHIQVSLAIPRTGHDFSARTAPFTSSGLLTVAQHDQAPLGETSTMPSAGQSQNELANLLGAFLADARFASEISATLAKLPPGAARFVKGEFVRQEAPWRLGDLAATCPRNMDCTSLEFSHYWLIKPPAGSPYAVALLVGGGTTEIEYSYPKGLPPQEAYSPTSDTEVAILVARRADTGEVVQIETPPGKLASRAMAGLLQ